MEFMRFLINNVIINVITIAIFISLDCILFYNNVLHQRNKSIHLQLQNHIKTDKIIGILVYTQSK